MMAQCTAHTLSMVCLGSRAIANQALQFSCQMSEGLGSRLVSAILHGKNDKMVVVLLPASALY